MSQKISECKKKQIESEPHNIKIINPILLYEWFFIYTLLHDFTALSEVSYVAWDDWDMVLSLHFGWNMTPVASMETFEVSWQV